MNVRTLCLAILHHQDATGYEIRKLSTEGKYAYFVDASFGSIYPALAKLEDDGLVTSRQEQQPSKPPRKVYMINEAGREELRLQLREAPTPDIYRSEFLLVGMCSDLLDPVDVQRALAMHTRQIEDKLVKINEMEQSMKGQPQSWLVDFGRHCVQAHLDWVIENRERIISASAAADTVQTAAE
ncbi:MAG: PadR family transcriptional regulator [Pseudomonadota bacterium]